ncbi:MAG: hypothetical protein K2P92_04930 [Bdellovibrionaceae bacterium]|nr:hypothetical protein [Pseudobdellovibrionaceae bacterium]
MTAFTFETLRYFIFASVLVYFIYDYFDQKRVKDEREELIKLKTYEYVQKISLFCICLLATAYLLYPQMPTFVPLIVLVVTSMYSEIFAKLYLRRKY